MVFDIIGWMGSGLVLTAYLLLSMHKIKPGMTYQLLNLVAAVCLVIALFEKEAWFSVSLNTIWAVIALVAIVRLFYKRSGAGRKPARKGASSTPAKKGAKKQKTRK